MSDGFVCAFQGLSKMSRHLFLRCAVILAVAIFLPLQIHAQSSDGTLIGTVTDQSGAAVANASVKALSAQYGTPRETTSDGVGAYRMGELQPGTYVITFTAPGFAELQVANVVMSGSQTTTVNAKLQLSTVKNTVIVEATAAEVIDTQSGQLGETMGPVQINNLPYFSLNPAELALTLPGVQDVPNNAAFTNGIGFSVNGTRPRANNFLIDGQDDNDYSISGQAFQPTNYGAVQEITILTNSYTAEYGRGGGSVTNYIFKSGSNAFHGQAYEINRDSAFAAVPAQILFTGDNVQPLDIENTFGWDLGGPVVKGKLFFFASMQWDRERQRANGSSFELPTANGIATLNSLLPNANVQLFLNSIGNFVAPSNADGTGAVLPECVSLSNGSCVNSGLFEQQGVPVASNDRQMNFRLDYHTGPKDTLTASYIRDDFALSPDFFNNSGALPPFQTQQGGPSQLFRGQWTHVISGSIVNQLRFSYTNIDFTFGQTPATLAGPLANIPEFDFAADAGYPSLGVGSGFPQGRGHHIWQGQDAFSYNFRQHTIKFGADITFLNVTDQVPFNSRGDISFAASRSLGISSFGNFADNFTGPSGTVSLVFGNPIVNPAVTLYAPYVEDTWRIKENFTVDLGLRYEYWGTVENSIQFPALNYSLGFGVPGASFPSLFSNRQQPDRNNFGPRVGFAYTPHWGHRLFGNDKTVIRAGYGVFYDGLFTNILDNTAASAPNATGGNFTGGAGRGLPDATGLLASITPAPNAFTTVDTITNKLANPVTQQWNLDIQREFAGFIVTAAYVGTRGTQLFANQDLNPEVNFGPDRLNNNFGEIVVRSNAAQSKYNAAQLEVEKRFHSDLTLRGSYTYSKFLDDSSEVFTTNGLSSFAQNLENQKSDMGPSAFDRKHRFVLAYVWALPYSRANWFTKAVTDRWQWSSIATIESGTPDTVVDGFDNIGTGHPNARPDTSNPQEPITAVGIDATQLGLAGAPGTFVPFNAPCFNSLGTGNPVTIAAACPFEPASSFRFIVPAIGPGNLGRNALFGPGQVFFDTAVERKFPIPWGKFEHQSLSFRVDLFNAFNHANLFTPSFDVFNFSGYANTASTVSGGRQIKFWLKYEF